ncbi:MAG: ComF family protein [Planctomycetota bacterium]
MQGLNHLLWPAVCCNCGDLISETNQGLCRICWNELLLCTAGDYCVRCGRDASRYAQFSGGCVNCSDEDIYFDEIARAGIYSKALAEMILSFKLRDRLGLTGLMAFLADSALQGSSFLADVDMFEPVPIHWRRRLLRGYNQAAVIAEQMKCIDGRLSADLVRIRATRKQVSVSLKDRQANVAGAFAVRRGHKYAGRNVCLIDDIKTSGATLNECAKTLKQAGTHKVYALVLAVAGQVTD